MQFCLDIVRSQQEGVCTLTLMDDTTKATHTVDENHPHPLVKQLIAEEKKYSAQKKKFDFFRLRPNHTLSFITQLAGAGLLYIGGKRAVLDLFSKITVHVDALIEGDEVVLSPSFSYNNELYSLSDFQSILKCQPHIAIKAPFILFFDDSIDWDDIIILQKGYLTRSEYREWKKHTLLACNAVEQELAPPQPKLILQDVRGLFADIELCNGAKFNRYEHSHIEQQLLDAGYQYKPVGTSCYFCSQEKIVPALKTLITRGWHLQDRNKKSILLLTHCDLSYEMKHDVIEIQANISTSNAHGKVQDYIHALRNRCPLMPMSDGSLGLITSSISPSLLDAIEFISDRPTIQKKLIGLLEEITPHAALSIPEISLPNSFSGSLRFYQQEGVQWLISLAKNGFGGILADDMGLGKTIQAIAFLASLPANSLSLVVAPTSLLINWQREIDRFFPNCPIYCHHGIERNTNQWPISGIVISSYGTIRQDIDDLLRYDFTACILDEAQMIKNESSITAQAIYKLKRSCTIAMTGTPIENSPKELFSQLRATTPGLLEKSELHAYSDPAVLRTIQKKIRPFILRRKKEDVAKELPPLIEQTIAVELEDDELEQYKKTAHFLKQGLVTKISQDGVQAHRMEILEAILRLRQLICHPLLVEQLACDHILSSSKFELLFSDLETLRQEGKKVIVFSQFTEMLRLIQKEASSRSWPYLVLDGTTIKRQEVVDQFQNSDISLLLMTMKAGGVGLNLTAADAIILYDPWWNRAQEAQAIARAHRIGRTGTVLVKRYIAQESIEENIQRLQLKKQEIEMAFLHDDLAVPENMQDLILDLI